MYTYPFFRQYRQIVSQLTHIRPIRLHFATFWTFLQLLQNKYLYIASILDEPHKHHFLLNCSANYVFPCILLDRNQRLNQAERKRLIFPYRGQGREYSIRSARQYRGQGRDNTEDKTEASQGGCNIKPKSAIRLLRTNDRFGLKQSLKVHC